MTAKQFYEQYLGTTVSDYSITTIKMLEDYAAIAIAEHDEAVKLRILEMEQEVISNATYSDTEYDNEAVVYGYNEAIADIIGNAFNIK